jgi:peroxiredoxin
MSDYCISGKVHLISPQGNGALIRTIFMAISFLVSTGTAGAQTGADLAVGQTAPDFSLPYATKDSVSRTPLHLSDLVGKANIVLAFYPADWSPGCTKEVCTIRDNFAALEGLKAQVLAISGDYVWSHHEWAKYQNLSFKLLSDHTHQVAKAYDSYNERSHYNKRTVYVINKGGKIAYIDPAYSVADMGSFNKLKQALAALK